MFRLILGLAPAIFAFGLSGFAGETIHAVAQDAAGGAQQAVPGSPVKKVLLIGIDGCRFDALRKADTPHFDRLIASGAYSPAAQILGSRYRDNDTISGPGWSSILTGVWADKHGVHDNSFRGKQYEQYPHAFVRLKEVRPMLSTASFVTWEPIASQITAGADVSRAFEAENKDYATADERCAKAVAERLATADDDCIFFYIGQVDETGHAKGFHPTVPEYIAAIERADRLVGEVLNAIDTRATRDDEDWLIIITSDHGGAGLSHSNGHDNPEILNSMLIVSGAGVRPGPLPPPVEIVDAVATAATHLGVTIDDQWGWDGKPQGLDRP
ncbi:alkaline phosphatase family protein [Candidatus Laterigemmans baculatus]|uniref:alkaline phosphatase family protein n=1 Tax=Candidatus Laterigemmans baculatus TaxID=2770505 RepID=UPI0013DD37C5|nr:alkaline phosphatase family protein [Candidatus Laterigemmans baculatus]